MNLKEIINFMSKNLFGLIPFILILFLSCKTNNDFLNRKEQDGNWKNGKSKKLLKTSEGTTEVTTPVEDKKNP